MLVFVKGEKPAEEGENQQQTQPTNGTGPEGNPGQTVGGERAHYCTIPTPRSPLEIHNSQAFWVFTCMY